MIETGSGTHNVAPTGPVRPPSGRSGVGWIVVGLLVLVAALIGGSAGAVAVFREPAAPVALPGEPVVLPQEAARLAACAFTRMMVTYHHGDLDGYFEQMRAGSTGEFHDQFVEGAAGLRAAMETAQVSSTIEGEPECLSRSGAGAEYVVVAIVGQRLTNGTAPDGRSQRTTFALTMRKVDDRWLAAAIDKV
ncbi:hypothetical protein AB0I35_08600 [Nocardia sp. NPDC050378]|uniref:hypothetical protein n=1 Tax=Nocardia sp. NPDC050378 TaxID=3155400 RepID=UPI0033CA2E97